MPDQNPIAFTAPVYLTVAGAILGIVLTLAGQGLISRVQRRHENRGRAFDLRFELYSDFLLNVDTWAGLKMKAERAHREMWERIRESEEASGDLKKAIDDLQEMVALVPKSKRVEDMTPEVRAQFQREGPKASKRLEEAEAHRKIVIAKRDRLVPQLDEIKAELEEAKAQTERFYARVQILADLRTLQASVAIVNAFKDEQPLTAEMRGKFRKAARRELALRDGPHPLMETAFYAKKGARKLRGWHEMNLRPSEGQYADDATAVLPVAETASNDD